jgi:hypothetical protein
MRREDFREQVCERDGYECIVPWCPSDVTPDPEGPGEQHHILDKELWPDGGYRPKNGVNVCNDHHRMSENNEIPPQAHWRWIVENAGKEGTYVPLPADAHEGVSRGDTVGVWTGPETASEFAVDKWGESFDSPPHGDIREYHKYPSTRHLLPLYWHSDIGTAAMRTGRDDTGLTSVESFLDIPLVTTVKMDGSNAMLVADTDEPVRARNGRDAEHGSFDHLKQEYWDRNVYENLPDHLQVFGENLYAKHSIHYGCPHDGCGGCDRRNMGPAVRDVFVVFGVYDTRFDLWLSWPETEAVADQIGFPTAFVYDKPDLSLDGMRASGLSEEHQFIEKYTAMGKSIVEQGHEGFIVRSMYPFHWAQFDEKVAKFVRCNHVQTDEHWSHQQTTRNKIERFK